MHQRVCVKADGGNFARKRDAVSRETERLKSTWVNPRVVTAAEAERVLGKAMEHEYNLFDLLRRPNVSYENLMSLEGGRFAEQATPMDPAALEQVEIAAKYSGYIDRQRDEVERASHYENLKLPADLDYLQIAALSFEVRQKLNKHRPDTLGQASRISGVTPAAVSLILVHLKRGKWKAALAGADAAPAETSGMAA